MAEVNKTQQEIIDSLLKISEYKGGLNEGQRSIYEYYQNLKEQPEPNLMGDLQKQYNMPLNKSTIETEITPKYDRIIKQYEQSKQDLRQTTNRNAQSLWGDYYQRIRSQQRNNVRNSALSGVQMAQDILQNLNAQQTVAGLYSESAGVEGQINQQINDALFQKGQEVSDIYSQRNMFLNEQLQREDYNKWMRTQQELALLTQLAESGVIDSKEVENYYNQNMMPQERVDQLNLEEIRKALKEAKKKYDKEQKKIQRKLEADRLRKQIDPNYKKRYN